MAKRLWRVSRFVLLCSLPLAVGCGTGRGCGGGGGERKLKFNESVAVKHGLRENEYTKLRYYLAADLVLTREVEPDAQTRERIRGRLVSRQGKTIEEVAFMKGTPGKCLSTESKDGQHTLAISFEESMPFKFVRGPSESGYTVAGKNTNDDFEVQLGGNTYKTTRMQVEAAYLEVSEASLNEVVIERSKMTGRRLE